MYLKSLELTGFKSFGKRAYLEFNSPISAIVGPNGSGKSNIAEAFRFVLGEQSIKSMRGKKGEDLIFNGGKSATRSNRAAVKVVFDNKDRLLNIDFDEVTIERAVLRDGINEYKINGSDVRLKDISELLFSAHIGSSGHHIISQGEADRMLSATTKERKEILEEALGLKAYQYKKEEGKRKLERTEDNMKETESLLRELAPHLRFLRKQYEKIEKAAVVREELIGIAKSYLKNEGIYIEKKKNEIESVRIETTKLLETLIEDEKRLQSLLSVIPAAPDGGTQDSRLVNLESILKTKTTGREYATQELGKLDGELSYIFRNIKKLQDEELKEKNKTVLVSDIELLEIELKAAGTLEQAIKLVQEFIAKHKVSGRENNQILELQKEIVSLEEKKKTFLEQVRIAEEEMNSAHLALEKVKNEIQVTKQASFQSEKDLIILRSNKREAEQKLSSLKVTFEMLEEENSVYKADLQELGFMLGRDVLNFEGNLSPTDRLTQHETRRTIEKLKVRLEEAGVPNISEVTKEFKDTEERDAFLRKELGDLEISKKSLEEMIVELEAKIEVEFKSGIEKINHEFNNFFHTMFGGGRASLQVLKERIGDEDLGEESVNEVVEIAVELPHKKTKGLMMLSGGERALTSIALLFAMSRVNPPPFIILDETDAALDEANSRKYGDMIEKLAAHSELILITHNRETMSRAGIIYGVTMAGEGSSRLLSIQFDEAVKVAK